MAEITVLEPAQNLPAIGETARRGMRSAIELWLAGYASDATRRGYRGELDAFAQFGGHDDAESLPLRF